MGSPYTVQIVDGGLTDAQVEEIKGQIEARLKEVNRQMSNFQPDSEVSQFNRAPADVPFKVSPQFAKVARFGLELYHLSEGAFDPTLAPVINLWGFGEKPHPRTIPADSELSEAMKAVGGRHFSVAEGDELIKTIPNLELNLSAIVKGFGTDEIARVLTSRGVTNVYVAIAGEVLALGHNPSGTKWKIGIAAPVSHWTEDDPMAAALWLSNQAVSTSGDYQKYFTDPQGRRLGHIFDPKTGWPVQHNVASVSVVAPDSMSASPLATTLFVLGLEKGMKFIESWTNAAALFILREPDGRFRQAPSSRFFSLTGYQTE